MPTEEVKKIEEFKFNIDEPTEKFKKHLAIEFNDRIILSAAFGSGKTYFLREFFKERKDKYEVIHLFPVNYSVASNEDIFELIKYDILFELMGKKEVEFEKVDYNIREFLEVFLIDEKTLVAKTLTPLLSFIPKVGKSLKDVSKKLIEFYEQFEKQLKDVQIDEEKAVIEYLKSFTEKIGSIYEEDFYTQLICQLVNHLKGDEDKKTKKETVLIIDDLDRIDPEHIFRILNVLAAQMDNGTGDNKFDFDKIILVFDQHNVRNIFNNRYGADVDYTGYIDKFYSYKVFEFTNVEGIRSGIQKILETITYYSKKLEFNKDNKLNLGIVYVLQKLIQISTPTVRQLLKTRNQTINIKSNYHFLTTKEIDYDGNIEILRLAGILLFIYEDWELLLNSAKKIIYSNDEINYEGRRKILELVDESLLLIDYEQHKFKENKEGYEYENKKYDLTFVYDIHVQLRKGFARVKDPNNYKLYDSKTLILIYLALEKIRNENIIQIQ